MLVLGRKKGDVVLIGNAIQVVVVSVEGDRVRLGFVAPPEVVIVRKEIHGKPRKPQRPTR